MQPDAQQPNSDPYGFIMNEQKSKKRIIPTANTKRKRIILVVSGIILVFIIAIVTTTILSGISNQTEKNLKLLAEQQNEIIRISNIGIKNAQDTPTQILARTTSLTFESDQHRVINYLKTQKQKMSTAELALKKNTQTDTQLNQAAQSNQFDKTFNQVITTQLIDYQKAVKQTYDSATGKNARKLLNDLYSDINVLATQIKNAQSN
jgi:biopolymer transport protein ExbB/TolQ